MLRPELSAPRTLIADDQPDVLEALHLLLKREGYQIEAVNSPKAVLERLHNREYDVLLMDLNYALDTTSGQEGLDLLASVQKLDHTLPVIVMTAWGSIKLAGEAMRRGAADFVEKPWDNSKLLSTLRTQIESRNERRSGAARESGEIEEASATQRGLLPRSIPDFPGYGISAAWRPRCRIPENPESSAAATPAAWRWLPRFRPIRGPRRCAVRCAIRSACAGSTAASNCPRAFRRNPPRRAAWLPPPA